MAQLILIGGRDNADNKPTIWQFNPGPGTYTAFHKNPDTNATAYNNTASGFRDIHIKDANNIAAVGGYSGARAWISYLRDGVWYDWSYAGGATQYAFGDVVIRPDGKLWITGHAPTGGGSDVSGLVEFDPDLGSFGVLRTTFDNLFAGIQEYAADGSILVMNHNIASGSYLRHPNLFSGGGWASLGDQGDSADPWNAFDYYNGKVYVADSPIGTGARVKRRDGSWVTVTSNTAQTSRYCMSLKVFSDSDIYLLHASNSSSDLRLAHYNGATWTDKHVFGAGWGGKIGQDVLRFVPSGRAYVLRGLDADYQRLEWSDDLAAWSGVTLPYRSGKASMQILDANPAADWLIGGRSSLLFSAAGYAEIQKYSGGSFSQKYLAPSDFNTLIASFHNRCKNLVAAGSYYNGVQPYNVGTRVLLESTDGDSWSVGTRLSGNPNIVRVIRRADGQVWVALNNGAGGDGIYRHDGGDAFTLLRSTGGSVLDILYVDDDNIWIAGSDIYQWDGATWNARGSNKANALIGDGGFSSTFGLYHGKINRWDGGTTWATVHDYGLPAYEQYLCGHFESATNFWVGGLDFSPDYRAKIWHWNGSALSQVYQSAASGTPHASVGILAIKRSTRDGMIIAVGRATNGVMVESFDGSNWTEVTTPASFNPISLHPMDHIIDVVPPDVTPVSPTSGQNVDRSTPVVFDVVDAGGTLVASSVRVWIHGTLVWDDDGPTSGYSGSKDFITNGFRYNVVKRDAPWDALTTHSVQVMAQDCDENQANVSWAFKTSSIIVDTRETFDAGTFYPEEPGNGTVDQSGGGALRLDATIGTSMDWTGATREGTVTRFPVDYGKEYESVTAEYVITSRVTADPANSDVIAGFMIDDDNALYVESGSGVSTDFRVVQISGGIKTVLGSYGGTPVTGDAGVKITVMPGTDVVTVEINPDYSADPEAYEPLPTDITDFMSNDFVAPPELTGVVGMTTEPGNEPAQSVDLSFLLLGGDPDGVRRIARDDIVQVQDEVVFPDQVGPDLHNYEFSGGQLMPGPTAQQPGSIGPFDNASVKDEILFPDAVLARPGTAGGRDERQMTSPEDAVRALLGTQGTFNDTTLDNAFNAHFLEKGVRLAFYYNTAGEDWADPVGSGLTGYARDGQRYTAGVLDGGPVVAPWASEAFSTSRGNRDDFPERVLIVATDNYLTLFDLTDFPTTFPVWMRFTLNTTTLLLRKTLTAIRMVNGVLCLSNYATNGGLTLIDFKGDAPANTAHLIRGDGHWLWNGTLAQRNTPSLYTASGVSPSLRIDSELNYDLDVHKDGSKYYAAISGEDDTHVVEVDGSLGTVPQRSFPTGEINKPVNVGDIRNVVIDEYGWLWMSEQRRLVRNATQWKDGVVVLEDRANKYARGVNDHWPVVELPYEITQLAAARNYIYCGTEVGIYRVNRGTLEVQLAYTFAGGGGGGRLNNPPDGELLLGDMPQILWMRAFSLDASSYLSVAMYQGSVTIRLYDDNVTQGLVYPALYEHRAYFNTSVIS